RSAHLDRVFGLLFPGKAFHVVNNNAAAVLLTLNTLAEGKEVIVSRGELVEIGGSFRIPDVMRKSGAVLREVGATNKTRLSDYERAIGPQAGLIVGRRDLVGPMKENSLTRALRVDKVTYAALETVLLEYVRGTAESSLPVLRMVTMTPAVIEARARLLMGRVAARAKDG